MRVRRVVSSTLLWPTEPNGVSEFNTFVTAISPGFRRDQSFVWTSESKERTDELPVVGPEYAEYSIYSKSHDAM